MDILQNRIVAALQSNKNQKNVNMTLRREEAAENMKREKQNWKQRFNGSRRKPIKYNVDDIVVIENIAPSTGESRKLEHPFRGPYVVKKILDKDRYDVIADIEGMPHKQKPLSTIMTSEKMTETIWTAKIDEHASDSESISCQEGANVATLLTCKEDALSPEHEESMRPLRSAVKR